MGGAPFPAMYDLEEEESKCLGRGGTRWWLLHFAPGATRRLGHQTAMWKIHLQNKRKYEVRPMLSFVTRYINCLWPLGGSRDKQGSPVDAAAATHFSILLLRTDPVTTLLQLGLGCTYCTWIVSSQRLSWIYDLTGSVSAAE